MIHSLTELCDLIGLSAPIKAGGKLYGAVGVSGAPDGMDDEKCATAGLDAVLMDLEMQ